MSVPASSASSNTSPPAPALQEKFSATQTNKNSTDKSRKAQFAVDKIVGHEGPVYDRSNIRGW